MKKWSALVFSCVILPLCLMVSSPAFSLQEEQQSNFAQQEKKLNMDYKTIRARLKSNKAVLDSFVSAQRAWLKFRQAECAFKSKRVEGGTAHSMAVAACYANLDAERIKDFLHYLHCEEGNLTCPVPAGG